MSRESSQVNEDSKLADGRGAVPSSASNDYLDGACEMSSRLIIELPVVAEDRACSEEDNEDQFVGVRNRKLTEKGWSYQTEMLLRGQCNELPTWKQEFSKVQVLWNEFTDAYNEIREIVESEELAIVGDIWE